MEACALALQSADLRKREGERRSDLNDEHCLAGPGLRALRAEEGRSVFFFTTLGFPAGARRFESWFFLDSFSVAVEKAYSNVDELYTNRTNKWSLCWQRCSPTSTWPVFADAHCKCDSLEDFPADGLKSFRVGYFIVEDDFRLTPEQDAM